MCQRSRWIAAHVMTNGAVIKGNNYRSTNARVVSRASSRGFGSFPHGMSRIVVNACTWQSLFLFISFSLRKKEEKSVMKAGETLRRIVKIIIYFNLSSARGTCVYLKLLSRESSQNLTRWNSGQITVISLRDQWNILKTSGRRHDTK